MYETQGSDPMWPWKNLKKPGAAHTHGDTMAQDRRGAAEVSEGSDRESAVTRENGAEFRSRQERKVRQRGWERGQEGGHSRLCSGEKGA